MFPRNNRLTSPNILARARTRAAGVFLGTIRPARVQSAVETPDMIATLPTHPVAPGTPMNLRLLVSSNLGPAVPFETSNPQTMIGRAADCQVRFAASNVVSTHHAVIELTETGAFITDLNSRNGTFVNDRPVTHRMALREGDEVQLGRRGPTLRVERLDVPDGENMTVFESVAKMPPRPARVEEPEFVDDEPRAPRRRPAAATADDDYPRPARRHQSKQTMYLIGGGGVLAAVLVGVLIWQLGRKKDSPGGGGVSAPLSAEEMYRRQLDSAVYIEAEIPHPDIPGQWTTGLGSGCLIDRQKKLVLTAHHVIAGNRKIEVFFPKFKDGKPVTDHGAYTGTDAVTATVLKTDPVKDLTILQLASVPDHVKELPMAKDSPQPAEEVYTVGGKPRGSKGLWIPTKGSVREVAQAHYSFRRKDGTVHQTVDAWVISTSNPINPGDSGGALVNKNCELIGVCSASDPSADLVRSFIDLREVKDFMGVKTSSGEAKKSDGPAKIDPARLVGRWKWVSGGSFPPGTVFEFTAAGNLVVHASKNGAPVRVDIGSYRLAGDKLTLVSKKAGEPDEIMTVRLENDRRLVLIDGARKELVFDRQ